MTPAPPLDGCPIFDALLAEHGGPVDPVEVEYEVIVAQAVMDLAAGRTP